MKKNPDIKFKEELQEVKSKLPHKYFVVLNYLYPGKFTPSKVYNVVNGGLEDREVLTVLKKIAKIESKKK